MSRFLGALHSGRVQLMDGAMGTELQRRGLQADDCSEAWNLIHPAQVRAVHEAYRNAGADCLLTNTFQANGPALERHQRQEQIQAIAQSALALARAAAKPDGFVIGDMGPIILPDSCADHLALLDQAVRALEGSDAALLETISDSRLPRLLARWAAGRPAGACWPLLLSFTYHRFPGTGQLLTQDHEKPEHHAALARDCYGAAALGVNCGRDIGMGEIIAIVQSYRRETDLPVFARPNAGTPTRVGDRWVYPLTPEAMAARLPDLLEAGVRMVGGCCGTTPAHIMAMRPVIDAWNARGQSQGTSPHDQPKSAPCLRPM